MTLLADKRIAELAEKLQVSGLEVVVPAFAENNGFTVYHALHLPKLGIFRDNWRMRTIHMHGDAAALDVSKRVWTVGVWDSLPRITLAYEDVGMNYAIAADYWKHGEKVYERD